jgi:hypothetical protein
VDFPPKDPNIVNKSWIDFEAKTSESGGDADSERAIMEQEIKGGEIRKTVRVMVEGSRKEGEDGYISGQKDVGKFECV